MKRSLALGSFLTAASLFAAAGQAAVVISHVYGGGGGSGTYKEDYVVLFNNGTTPETLTDAQLTYASATGNFGGNRIILPTSLTIQPGKYYLIDTGSSTGATTNSITALMIEGQPLVPDFIASGSITGGGSGTISAAAASGKIALIANVTNPAGGHSGNSPSTLAVTGGTLTVVDFVGYGTTNTGGYEGTAAAPTLTNATVLVRDGLGCDDTQDNAADFSAIATSEPTSVRTGQSSANVCGAPQADLVSTISLGSCGVSGGGAVTITATVTNNGTLAAADTQAVITLPSELTFVSSSGGTASYNSTTRELTWTVGALPFGGGASSLTINTMASGQGTLAVTQTATTSTTEFATGNNTATGRNFVAFSGPGYNSGAVVHLMAVPQAYETETGFDAGAVGQVQDTLGSSVKLRAIVGRPTASANGSRIIFWGETAAGDGGGGNFDGLLIAGHVTGTTLNLQTLAAENATQVDVANGRFISPGVTSQTHIATSVINDAGQYAFATNLQTSATPVTTVRTVATGSIATPGTFTILARQGEAPNAGLGLGAGVTWGNILGNVNITNAGSVAFGGNVAGTGVTDATNYLLALNNGATLYARKGVTVPSNSRGTNAGGAVSNFGDNVRDLLGFSMDATGNTRGYYGHILASGGTTGDDEVFVVGNEVKLQEGHDIQGSGITSILDVGTGSNANAALNIAAVFQDGHWFGVGDFEADPATGNGGDFVVRDGAVVARTGQVVATGSGETWSDAVVANAFTSVASQGDDYVITGLTNETDRVTDNVAVWKNGSSSQIILREGQPLTINERTFFVNFVPAFRGQTWISTDRRFFTYVTLFDAGDVCSNNFNAPNPSALISVALPPVGPTGCGLADVASAGQQPGADGELTADDIIVFIGFFFSGDSRGDVASAGQVPGADGEFTADDIIVFIGAFFAGC